MVRVTQPKSSLHFFLLSRRKPCSFLHLTSSARSIAAILILEADDEETALARLGELPLVAAGMLDLDIYPVGPYRGIIAASEA